MSVEPPNTTGRVFVKYVANGHQHIIAPRYQGTGAPDGDFLEGLDDFFQAVENLMPEDWAWVESTYQAAGSDVSLPLTFTPTTFDGFRTPKDSDAPAFASFVGRDSLGKRVKLSLLGVGYNPGEDEATGGNYRLTSTESAAVSDALLALVAANVVTISGNQPNWKSYANLGYNAKWQRKVRT